MEITRPSLPKGGGAITGIGETFQPQEFTGTASLSIPIPTSPCRGVEPQLSVDYSSGSGNGVFGLGWSLSVPNIARKTSKGIPRYDGSDIFLLSNAENLVPVEGGRRVVAIDAVEYAVSTYRPRIEGLFAKIERWVVKGSGDSFWRVISKDNVTSVYGASPGTRIADPNDPRRVFQWLLQETHDDKGNRTVYEYRAETPEDVPNTRCEKNRVQGANRYLARIKYGNGPPALTPEQRLKIETIEYGTEPARKTGPWEQWARDEAHKQGIPKPNWHFEVVFDYGDHTVEPEAKAQYVPPAESTRPMPRVDPYSTYHAGFEIRTRWRCRSILMFHRFPVEFGTEDLVLTHATRFHYSDPESGKTASKSEEVEGLSKLRWVGSIGFRRRKDGTYQTCKLPPLSFGYTEFEPKRGSFERFLTGDHRSLPGVESHPYQLVDLYGEGLPGVLYADGDTLLYWGPEGATSQGAAKDMGAVRYAPPRQPSAFPIHRDVGPAAERLMDLTGNGQLDLVVSSNSGAGYYQVEPGRGWQGFRALPVVPTDFADLDGQLMDFTGDGLSDLVRIEHDRVQVYRSRGKDGFGPSESLRRAPGLRWPTRNGPHEAVRFADMFGTGGQHLVQITSGRVKCWPHLGYGRFAEPVLFEHAPQLPSEFDPARLFLADLDGSGTADLIYAHDDRVEIWLNQCGNAFAKESLSRALPAPCSSGAQLNFADVLGTGTTALVFSDDRARPRHWYLDLSQGRKAHLLNTIDNKLGATSTITYASSTKFYLADKRAGRPWLTRLPFPVQVVERVETTDRISHSSLVRSFSYRHGYYDGEEREFRGFGMVERRDAETLSAKAEPTDMPPVVTRTWYHSGAAVDEGAHRRYRPEYYQGDPQDACLDDCVLNPPLDQTDGETLRHAHRALHGHVLRQEVFSEDATGAVREAPYTAIESSFVVQRLQARTQGRDPILFVHHGETISYHYECQAHDPRVEHKFTLQVDKYGHVLRSCQVSYPRRKPSAEHAEQKRLSAVAQVQTLLNVDTLSADKRRPLYLAGVPCEERSFELTGLVPKDLGLYLKAKDVRDVLDANLKLQAEHDAELGQSDGKGPLLSWHRTFYWNPDRTDALDYGKPLVAADLPVLLHHTEAAAFTNHQVQADSALGAERATKTRLKLCGYRQRAEGATAYWWAPGVTHSYHGPDAFFLPRSATDPLPPDAVTEIGYDPYFLVVAWHKDALGNETASEYDYHTLSPKRVIDPNGNVSQVQFDPMGRVCRTSVNGMLDGQPCGDEILAEEPDESWQPPKERAARRAWLKTLVENKRKRLGNSTSCHFYDDSAWHDERGPACVVSLLREVHVSEEAKPGASPIHVSLTYFDGLARIAQSKTSEDPAKDLQWLSSGWTVYNNKGKPVEEYEPFRSATLAFEADTRQGVTRVNHYDPLLRLIKIETPARWSKTESRELYYYFSKVAFTPWCEWHLDENATLTQTKLWSDLIRLGATALGMSEDEHDALEKAARHAGCATLIELDSQGRTFQTHQMGQPPPESTGTGANRPSADTAPLPAPDTHPEAEWLTTHHELNIQGAELSSTDPKLFRLNAKQRAEEIPDWTPHRSFRYTYDMTGGVLCTDSVDAGRRWNLHDVLGRQVHRWDERGHHFETVHDPLHRPTAVRLTEEGTTRIVERMVYGEEEPSKTRAQDHNLLGQIARHYDQAGRVEFDCYDLAGRAIARTRRLRKGYKGVVSWSALPAGGDETVAFDPHAVALEEMPFVSCSTYDALGRLVQEAHPDQSQTARTYHPRGELKNLVVTFADGSEETFVQDTGYNPRGQRTHIEYGNGVKTKFEYAEDWHLNEIKTLRDGTSKVIQDLLFAHDPLGNPTRVRDLSHEIVLGGQQKVEPVSDYTYDPLHRLVKATGREHPALTPRSDLARIPGHPDSYQMLHLNNLQQIRNYSRSYEYDPGGTLSRTRHVGASSPPRWWKSLQASPVSNRAVPKEWVSDSKGVDAYFDEHGNQTKLESAGEIRWNYHDHIESVSLVRRNGEGADDSEYYVYDASGQRVRKITERKTKNGVHIGEKIYVGNIEIKRTSFRPDGSPATATTGDENTGTTTHLRYALHLFDEDHRIAISHTWMMIAKKTERAPGEPWARTARYQLDNHVGTTALELDDEGKILSYEEYYPYGGTAFAAGDKGREVSRKEYRYSGKEQDDATGLYYYGARYYAPWLGRWMNPDPAGTVDGLNLYEFVKGNPVRFEDHRGLSFEFRKIRGKKSLHNRNANKVHPAPQPSEAKQAASVSEPSASASTAVTIGQITASGTATTLGNTGMVATGENVMNAVAGTGVGLPLAAISAGRAARQGVNAKRRVGKIKRWEASLRTTEWGNTSYGGSALHEIAHLALKKTKRRVWKMGVRSTISTVGTGFAITAAAGGFVTPVGAVGLLGATITGAVSSAFSGAWAVRGIYKAIGRGLSKMGNPREEKATALWELAFPNSDAGASGASNPLRKAARGLLTAMELPLDKFEKYKLDNARDKGISYIMTRMQS